MKGHLEACGYVNVSCSLTYKVKYGELWVKEGTACS